MAELNPDESSPKPEPRRPAQPRRLWPAVRALLKTRIVAGLAMVVPLWVTWVVAKFVFDTTRSATQPIVEWIASRVAHPIIAGQMTDTAHTANGETLTPAVLAENMPPYVDWIVPVVAVMLTLFLLYVLGFLTANVFGRRLLYLMESLFEHMPLVKTIYTSTKRIILTLGGSDAMRFKKVVLVEFPRPGMKCIGFLTSVMTDIDTGRKMATVFISTTPNPTTGYMQIVPLDEVSETGWTVEEAVKLLMSGGILSPASVPFDKVHAVEWNEEDLAANRAAIEM